MKLNLKATDNVGITTEFNIDNNFDSEEDYAVFFVELFVFLERAGADLHMLPDEIMDQIDSYYKDRN
jgi:hypothetical protein